MTATVLLFDVDGTLVSTDGAGRKALSRAFQRLFGRPDACDRIGFAGMTDRAIVRQALQAVGEADDPFSIEAVLEAYAENLDAALRETEKCRILPGVLQLLDQLAVQRGIGLGLGTGNIRRGAEAKLNRVGLVGRFAFGGFGCDAEDRTELLRVGWGRGAAHFGVDVSETRLVVIGDTPKDVAAARALQATSVAVATGGYTLEALQASGPDTLVPNLGVAEVWSAIISSLGPLGAHA